MKKTVGFILSAALIFSLEIPVQAETFYGDEGWRVVFTEEKEMESTFRTSDLNDVIAGMQPGDRVIFSLGLSNENAAETDWYMTNKVLYSLEDRSANGATSGGGYTYRLVYTDHTGAETILFDNDTVGGETVSAAGTGLHEATNALQDYFYLDTLKKEEGGSIALEVALDGETQNNDYQDTLADLQMNFAVELRPSSPSGGGGGGNPSPIDLLRSNVVRMSGVQTGDMTRPLVYAGIMTVSGLLLLALAVWFFRENRRRLREEEA